MGWSVWEQRIRGQDWKGELQVDLLQILSYSTEDHKKFPEGRGSKILKDNYVCFNWTEFLQACTNYILESEEEAMREEIGKTLARVLKPCQGWQWPQGKGQMANSAPDTKKLVGATCPWSWLLLWGRFWDNQQGFSIIFITVVYIFLCFPEKYELGSALVSSEVLHFLIYLI